MLGNRVKVEKALLKRLKEISSMAGYSSVDEFVMHVLEKEISKFAGAESEEEIKKRMRGLGYIS